MDNINDKCGFCGREVNNFMKRFYWDNIETDTCGDKKCYEMARQKSINKILERGVADGELYLHEM